MQIITAKDDSWVYASDNIAGNKSIKDICGHIRKRIYGVPCWIFDLDDNHAKSPGKVLAKRAFGTKHYSPSYLSWCAKTAWSVLTKDKDAETKMWKQYFDKFLSGEPVREEIRRMMTTDFIRSSLYPGVEDFCSMVSESKRFYVSRNLSEIVGAYADFFGFNGSCSLSLNKAEVVEEYFVRDRPHFQYLGVEGDSECDGEMAAALRFHGRDVFAILSSDKPVNGLDNTPFDINVSKDRTSLVRLLSEQK